MPAEPGAETGKVKVFSVLKAYLSSSFISSIKIWNKDEVAILLSLITAILSPLVTFMLNPLNKDSPSKDLLKSVACSIWSPASLSWLKIIAGYFRVEASMSSTLIFSNNFLRLLACFDLEALALNREIKSCNSFFLSSAFLFWFCLCFNASWLLSYQKE